MKLFITCEKDSLNENGTKALNHLCIKWEYRFAALYVYDGLSWHKVEYKHFKDDTWLMIF